MLFHTSHNQIEAEIISSKIKAKNELNFYDSEEIYILFHFSVGKKSPRYLFVEEKNEKKTQLRELHY